MSIVEETGSLRAEIVAVGANWSAAQRRLVRLVVELDESGEWALDGAPTCAHWVAAALGLEVCTAREWLRIGRVLAKLPEIDGAFDAGDLSYSKVRTLTRVATPENEAELLRIALRTPAGRLGHALASWLTRHETPEETEARQHAARSFSTRIDPDGMVAGFFRLAPLEAGRLVAAIDALVRRRAADASADASANGGVWPSIAQQRADALVELATCGGAAVETEVVVHVRGDGCALDDGTPVADSVVERIAPASFLRALIHDAERRPINASGRHRHPTDRQKRVVKERDRVCVDCGGGELFEYDHEPDFEISQHTLVEELRLRCCTCHHDRHRRGGSRSSGGSSP
jgi:hypothetical protein